MLRLRWCVESLRNICCEEAKNPNPNPKSYRRSLTTTAAGARLNKDASSYHPVSPSRLVIGGASWRLSLWSPSRRSACWHSFERKVEAFGACALAPSGYQFSTHRGVEAPLLIDLGMSGSIDLGGLLALRQFRPFSAPGSAATNAALDPAVLRFSRREYHSPLHLRVSCRSMDPPRCTESSDLQETQRRIAARPPLALGVPSELLEKLVYDALVWSSLHGFVVGDRRDENSGRVPGVGLVHAPFALLPKSFPKSYWRQACELAPIFNALVDRVSLDGKFLQESLSRTKKVDAFTSRLLDIHSKMLEINKTEHLRLGLHRSDYMLDSETNLLLQIEFNTISSSFPGLSCLVSELHRNLLNHYGKDLGMDSKRVPGNTAVSRFAEALAKAWNEYNNSSAVVMVVVQNEERNMYDQHWLCAVLRDMHGVNTIRKNLSEIEAQAQVLPDGTLTVDGQTVSVIYFRAGYSPDDYPSEAEWRARLLMEMSSAIKCPSIPYHLAGTKKIQQELAKPNVLERFLDNEDDIVKVRKCFAGLWSLDDPDAIKSATEKPDLFVLKPQREGGGNNIYGDSVRETLINLQKLGSEELAAFILMQRIFPRASPSFLVRDGIWRLDNAVSELGIYSAYLRNKDKVLMNDQCGYLMRTKVSSSNEGGVAAGFAVLDSIYLT